MSIIDVRKGKGKHSSCNTCGKSVDRGTEIHEIELGVNIQSTLVHLCTDCMGKFADKLWEYMSEK